MADPHPGPAQGHEGPVQLSQSPTTTRPASQSSGGRVEQYYALEAPIPLNQGTAEIWAEQLSATSPDTNVLLRYGNSNGWLDDKPAMITRAVGKGTIIYLGTIPDPNIMRSLLESAAKEANIQQAFGPVPEDIEVCRRASPDRVIYILINHGKSLVT